MKLREKLAEEAAPPQGRHHMFANAQRQAVEIKGFIEGFEAGFRKARELAAAKIKASVNLEGIKNPPEAFVNCALQAKHDHDLCLKIGEEEV